MTLVATRPRSSRPTRQPLPGATTRVRAARLDWLLMSAAALLLALGALLVWSATSARHDLTAGDPNSYLKRQLVNIAIGVVLGVMVAATDYRWVRILAPLVYVASVVGLVLVLVMGVTINGSRSWIQLGGMSIQPAEFAKLAVVIGMALLVAERTEGSLRTMARGEVGSLDVLAMLAIAAVPSALILLQPDLGTMLVLCATVFGVVAVSGARRTWLLGLFAGRGGGW
jgi:rod shape determining protein RodA